MDQCPKLEDCPFFKKYGHDLPDTCKAIISLYCSGKKMGNCARLGFKQKNGYPPPEDMMPNGDRLLA